ncbi:hypothetical protein SESBI_46971 [Sesbania bispinosa]|nr:hypothetical protein SESBI_46971 [Sesbania bispinosa]
MGNCQAVDAAALVIQHPCGKKIERLYWPVTASEIMRANPGHYVSLIMPLPVSEEGQNQGQKTVLYTRVKLLRPDETLTLGHAYRLITTQEVVKVLKAKKRARMRQPHAETVESVQIMHLEEASSACNESRQAEGKGSISNSAALRPKSWRPSLQSISESGS